MRTDKSKFAMFVEPARGRGEPTFILSAKRVGDSFFISRSQASQQLLPHCTPSRSSSAFNTLKLNPRHIIQSIVLACWYV